MRGARSLALAIAVGSLVQSQGFAATPTFQGLGDLAGEPFYSQASAVSGDGSTAVGGGDLAPYVGEAFLWNSGTMTGLGDLPGGWPDSMALGVSADGSVVVGYGDAVSGNEALLWQSGVMTRLGALPGGGSYGVAFDASGDGAVVVGHSASVNGDYEAFRWQGGVMTALGDLPGGNFSSAGLGVSADGSVVVGGGSSYNGAEAFRWENGVMTGLGDLPGGDFSSWALGVSADGSVVVGASSSEHSIPSFFSEAFRWENGVMSGLGALSSDYFTSSAIAVSGDGSVVVGTSFRGGTAYRAFVWTEGTGMLDLADVLEALGLDLAGWGLQEATGISDDGLTIVGYGGSPNGYEGWIATLPPNWVDEVSFALSVSIAKSGWSEWGTVEVDPNLAKYFVGKTVTLTAEANGAKAFKWWRLYDPNYPNDPNYITADTNDVLTLIMTSDRQVVAVFKCASGMPPLPALMLGMLGLFVLLRRRG